MEEKTYKTEEIAAYYDQTEVHYRMFWKLDACLGLHYGIWDREHNRLQKAIINTNRKLALLAPLPADMRVLDAGCGVGGSALYLADQYGCRVDGITLSSKQVKTAQQFTRKRGLDKQVRFHRMDYTKTSFPDQTFDVVWAIESMETASDKPAFFAEAARVLKPGGYLLIGDIFKPIPYPIENYPLMQRWLNGWAMSDLLDIESLLGMARRYGFQIYRQENVNRQVWPSVWRLYVAGLAGFVGTKAYNAIRKASYFSRIHYRTGIDQYHAYRKGLWEYHLFAFQFNGMP